jgi:membrane protein YqaA with SNARE-associated domain
VIVNNESTTLDRWLRGRGVQVVAFAWGFAEATLFFIVPDVFLTFVGCRALRPALKATVAALVGALIGGAVTYSFVAPETILRVPGINYDLAMSVQTELQDRDLVALLIGPLRGIPYKVYAMEWAARGGSLTPFLLVSIPARWLRFAVSVVLARGVAKLLARWTRQRASIEFSIIVLFWFAFYAFYFAHFGW